jgi:hypothetical protein
MTRFVDECRKEWGRLGVPEAESNEMAADLEADLAEARADGASPEQVLGNGYFDARSFAASWARARGLVPVTPRVGATIRVRSLVLALSALIGIVVAVVGLLILVRPRIESEAIAAGVRPSPGRPFPYRLVIPHGHLLMGPAGALDPMGWILLALGLAGLGVTLFVWRPWSTDRDRQGLDHDAGMPSFL